MKRAKVIAMNTNENQNVQPEDRKDTSGTSYALYTKAVDRRSALKIGLLTLGTALPLVVTLAPRNCWAWFFSEPEESL